MKKEYFLFGKEPCRLLAAGYALEDVVNAMRTCNSCLYVFDPTKDSAEDLLFSYDNYMSYHSLSENTFNVLFRMYMTKK